MLRLVIASLSILAVAGMGSSSALAETVRDSEHNFRITMPDGWKTEKNPSDDVRLMSISANAQQTGGSCNVVTEAHPKSTGLTQAQVDEALKQEVSDAAWAAMFKSVIFISDVTIEKTGTQEINGHKAYYVVATFNSIDPGAPIVPVKLKQYLHAIPGEAFFVTCSALQSGYAQEEETFQTVFDSFSTLADRVALSQPEAVPSLTLYARANFGGVSRVVTQDTPDLALAGWQRGGGSISVAGRAVWQVCDGVDYAGHCRVISSALRQGAGAASARRLSPAQTTFGVLLQAGGAQSAGARVPRH
jgi:hypothetical protein